MMVMVALSQEAQTHLERYLKQIKAALRGHPSIDSDEVERDVLGHIDTELSGQPEPVAASRLLQVLERLGPPDQWVPDDPAWQRAVNTLRPGPGDWRLAFLTIGLFIAGPTLFMSGRMLWPLPPLLMVTSFLLARVTVSLFEEHDEPVDARRWLIYPPLVVWYAVFLGALFGGPVLLTAIFVSDDRTVRASLVDWLGEPAWLLVSSLIALLLGVWWAILALALARLTGAVRATFLPFADWFEPRHAMRIAFTGLILAAASGAAFTIARMLR